MGRNGGVLLGIFKSIHGIGYRADRAETSKGARHLSAQLLGAGIVEFTAGVAARACSNIHIDPQPCGFERSSWNLYCILALGYLLKIGPPVLDLTWSWPIEPLGFNRYPWCSYTKFDQHLRVEFMGLAVHLVQYSPTSYSRPTMYLTHSNPVYE